MSGSYDSPATEVLNHGRGLIQSHRPASWLYAALIVAGAVLGFLGLGTAMESITVSSGLGIAGLFVFATLVFWLILQLSDLDPKPMGVAVGAFLGGALISTSVAQFITVPVSNMFGKVFSDSSVVTACAAATGEESYKALVVVLIFLVVPWWWRRPLDGVVFGALVGLGFQIYEDIVYISGAASVNTGAMGSLSIFVDRVVIAGFYSHAVWTAFFGLGFAYAMTAVSASRAKRIGAVALAFALAWGGHVLWDYPILGSLLESGVLGTIAFVVLKSLPFVLIMIPLVVKAVKDERSFFHRHAQPEIDSGVLTDDDLDRLDTFGGRIKARRSPNGHQAKYRLHHLMRAQLDLVRLHMHGFTEPEALEDQRSFIEELKR